MFRLNSKTKNNILHGLGPLYHNYSFFGVDNDQLPGIYELNQKAKAPIISAYIAYAIAKSKRNTSDIVSFTELFCADGFYAMVASRLGCNRSIGIDNDRDKHFTMTTPPQAAGYQKTSQAAALSPQGAGNTTRRDLKKGMLQE
ncbi:MAG: hypothetical protein ABSC19_21030 [Syntrophorhabdales bacterium]